MGFVTRGLEIQEIDKATRTMVGKASTTMKDRHRTTINQEHLEKAIAGYTTRQLYYMHDPYAIVGETLDISHNKSENATYLKARLGEGFDFAFSETPFTQKTLMSVDNLWKQIESCGGRHGLSIGFNGEPNPDQVIKKGDRDTPVEWFPTDLVEVSLATIPSNPETIATIERAWGRGLDATICPLCAQRQGKTRQLDDDAAVREALERLRRGGMDEHDDEDILVAMGKELHQWMPAKQ